MLHLVIPFCFLKKNKIKFIQTKNTTFVDKKQQKIDGHPKKEKSFKSGFK